MHSCPHDGDCPMLAFVGEGNVRRAMQRLLCSESFEECVWMRIKPDVGCTDGDSHRRMQRVLLQLNAAA